MRVLQKLLCALGELEDMYMPIESAIGNRRLLKVEELASILTLKPKTIYNRLSKGQHFPIPVKRVGRESVEKVSFAEKSFLMFCL